MRTIRLQYLADIPITNGLGLPAEHGNENWPRYVRTTDIESPLSMRDDVFASQPPEIACLAPLQRNDIVASAAGTVGKSMIYASDRPACYAGFLVRFRASDKADPRFILHWMQSAHYWSQIERGSVRSTIDNFSASKYRALEVPDYPLTEQRRIADFLDDRVARIDKIIAARRQQLEEVAALKQACIDQALSKMPETVAARRVVDILPGYAFPSGGFSGEPSDIPLLRGVNVGPGYIRWDESVYWPKDDARRFQRYRLSEGDVVIAMDRPWIGRGLRIGICGPNDSGSLLLQRVAKLSLGESSSQYLYWVFQGSQFEHQVSADLTGLSVPHLSPEQIGSYVMPWGSRKVRRDVVSEMTMEIERSQYGERGLKGSIAALQEYKKSLITAAVTGEFDVTTASTKIPEFS